MNEQGTCLKSFDEAQECTRPDLFFPLCATSLSFVFYMMITIIIFHAQITIGQECE